MEFEEKVTAVEHLFDGTVIDLDRETVQLPNGRSEEHTSELQSR